MLGIMYKKNKQNDKHRPSRGHMDTQDQERGKRKIMKDFEIFGTFLWFSFGPTYSTI